MCKLGGGNINLFPIPLLAFYEREIYVELIDKVLTIKRLNGDTTSTEQHIEKLVCAKYGLTEEEIKIIERN